MPKKGENGCNPQKYGLQLHTENNIISKKSQHKLQVST